LSCSRSKTIACLFFAPTISLPLIEALQTCQL
jgi:hypothetical protein